MGLLQVLCQGNEDLLWLGGSELFNNLNVPPG
jgi:hypothetical protein